MESTPVLITWCFDKRTGNPELDVYLDLTTDHAAENVKTVFTRATFTNTEVALFHVPQGSTREDLALYISMTDRKEVLEKLQKARVRIDEVVRKKHEAGNAVDFILGK